MIHEDEMCESRIIAERSIGEILRNTISHALINGLDVKETSKRAAEAFRAGLAAFGSTASPDAQPQTLTIEVDSSSLEKALALCEQVKAAAREAEAALAAVSRMPKPKPEPQGPYDPATGFCESLTALGLTAADFKTANPSLSAVKVSRDDGGLITKISLRPGECMYVLTPSLLKDFPVTAVKISDAGKELVQVEAIKEIRW